MRASEKITGGCGMEWSNYMKESGGGDDSIWLVTSQAEESKNYIGFLKIFLYNVCIYVFIVFIYL